MHEIEGRQGDGVARDVMAEHLDILASGPVQESDVDVGGNHATGGADALPEPAGNGAAARSHLKAAPARRQLAVEQMLPGPGVEQRGKRCVPGTRVCHRIDHVGETVGVPRL